MKVFISETYMHMFICIDMHTFHAQFEEAVVILSWHKLLNVSRAEAFSEPCKNFYLRC